MSINLVLIGIVALIRTVRLLCILQPGNSPNLRWSQKLVSTLFLSPLNYIQPLEETPGKPFFRSIDLVIIHSIVK